MEYKILKLDEKDDVDIIDEIDTQIDSNKELKKALLSFKKSKPLTQMERELLEIKFILSFTYTYENLMYYLFVMENKNELTFDELKYLTEIIKSLVEEDDLDHDSDNLLELIEQVTNSLKEVDLDNFCNEIYPRDILGNTELAYIYSRALFNFDIIIEY